MTRAPQHCAPGFRDARLKCSVARPLLKASHCEPGALRVAVGVTPGDLPARARSAAMTIEVLDRDGWDTGIDVKVSDQVRERSRL